MSENESDVQRERATDDRDNVVLTGEEIELPGDGSDAAAIIGEASEPIDTGEIESVAIGGLTDRVPGAAPLKPAIEDKIATGELPVVPAPAVEFADEADSDFAFEDEFEDASSDAPEAGGFAEQEAALADDFAVDDEDTEPSRVDVPTAKAQVFAEPVVEESVHSPIMTPAQAAAALGLNLDSVREDHAPVTPEKHTFIEEEVIEENNTGDSTYAVGGAAAEATEASSPSLSSRRSMIFGDDETLSSSIPAVAAEEENAPTSAEEEPEAEEKAPFTEPTTQLPTQDTEASYSFEDQDAAEAARPRRRSLLGEGNEDSEAATLAAIASTAARGDKSDAPSSLDDELFSAAPEITEMPSRTGSHWLSFLLFLLLVPAGWYLAADAGARMTLADAAPMYTGVASIVALGEILGAIIISAILFATARRSSLGAWLMGIVTLIVGLPWLMAPGITAASVLPTLTALTNTGSLGANLAHHLQASGYSGRFALLGIFLMGLAYVSHSARRTGRTEEALRTSLEATNPAGAFYSKRARKKAAKEAARK